MPGKISLTEGSSGRPGKRVADVMAMRRIFPAWMKGFAAVIELIMAWVTPAAMSWPI